jgi:hypothetical protein
MTETPDTPEADEPEADDPDEITRDEPAGTDGSEDDVPELIPAD